MHHLCGSINTLRSQSAIQVAAREDLAGDRYTVLATGRVEPGSGIARIELKSANGHVVRTAFANDAFLADYRTRRAPAKAPGPVPGGPYTADGYDTHGNRWLPRRVPGSS